REVGTDLEVHLDTGIMSGADIVAAIALGADFTLVGRAYLYGLMAGGREGVDRMIEILGEQITRTMRLLGVTSLAELTPAHVTQLERLAPRALSLPAATAPRPPAKATTRPSVTPKTPPKAAPPKAGPRKSPIAG
ncbi:MAG: alpha-hydroxy-acid oxidizing protein, partial [Candidatus Saccharibacteria bacterium]|nr:alpha-hydroxy-acid oxidizing protein [Microbacteriaceae bacterium]